MAKINAGLALTFISANADDAPRISALIVPLVKNFISCEYSPQGQQSMLQTMSESVIRDNIFNGFHYTLALANHQGEQLLAGVLGVKNPNHVFHLFVAERFHRLGIATALWQNFLEQSRETEFTVNSSRYAVDFYRSLGFQSSGQTWHKNGITCYPMVLVRAHQSTD